MSKAIQSSDAWRRATAQPGYLKFQQGVAFFERLLETDWRRGLEGLTGGLIDPPMNPDDLAEDAPRTGIDFRRVYAAALSQWLKFDARAILGADDIPLPMFT